MGLDWLPGNKPQPGQERAFARLLKKLQSESRFRREARLKRFHAISVTAYETLKAPRVGRDDVATDWARQAYGKEPRDVTEEKWLEDLAGYYVLQLLPPCDGLPRYSNCSLGYVERFSFRADFLKDCAEIVGDEMMERAYLMQSPEELMCYGESLIERAQTFAAAKAIDTRCLDTSDVDSIETRLDVVLAAGRWCVFWAERGHYLEPYF